MDIVPAEPPSKRTRRGALTEGLPFEDSEMLTALGRHVAQHVRAIAEHLSVTPDQEAAVVRQFEQLLAGFQVMEGIIICYEGDRDMLLRRLAELKAKNASAKEV